MWPPRVKKARDGEVPRPPKNNRATRKRRALFTFQDGVCCWHGAGCLYPLSPMQLHGDCRSKFYATLEHVVRRRDGGKDSNGNVRLAHRGCNEAREHPKHKDRFVSKGEQPDGPVHEA